MQTETGPVCFCANSLECRLFIEHSIAAIGSKKFGKNTFGERGQNIFLKLTIKQQFCSIETFGN